MWLSRVVLPDPRNPEDGHLNARVGLGLRRRLRLPCCRALVLCVVSGRGRGGVTGGGPGGGTGGGAGHGTGAEALKEVRHTMESKVGETRVR